MKPILLFLFTMTLLTSSLYGQKFFPAADMFSHQKPSHVTLTDGTVLEGELKDIDRKKGLIEQIKLEDASGNKQEIDADKIQHMYLPKSGFQKFADAYEFIYDARAWDDQSIERKYIEDGYVYFEQADVELKRKKRTLLMQLLNPSFCNHIRVYHDPLARETASFGVGNVTVAGGDEKSYYVKKQDGDAFKLEKKDYDDEFKKLFDNCDHLIKEAGKKPRWTDFAEHITLYNEKCTE